MRWEKIDNENLYLCAETVGRGPVRRDEPKTIYQIQKRDPDHYREVEWQRTVKVPVERQRERRW